LFNAPTFDTALLSLFIAVAIEPMVLSRSFFTPLTNFCLQ
jgi:hypothetical protein